ncbi:peptidase S45 penicillin amidase [Halosimplex carlsbadense 2-9-1]|uniref:Peptidase S45 penicillin amidase n=1 Tax=Halosimplex carlsbadense 2-9-1 TaxID=797114 RepID=M0CTG3_9EURY|nr:peptidase S45 penicillin amidase [Halosimplex carlsbadense 2-9-1]
MIAALLGGSVGAATLTDARGYLDRFAPLSGDAWGAATADTRERVATPYGDATVRYDDAGVPTVEAGDELSLYFAVGYVHAADRLFEMDLIRRRMRGTLSAAVGERTVESDRFHAQMDFASAAEASWRAVRDTPTGEAMRAYAAGVEAHRASEPLPLEFRLLDYEPAAWTPIDSMLVEKQISWGLTGSFRSLRRSAAADALDESAAATLYPERMDHDVPVLRGGTGAEREDTTAAASPTAATDVRNEGGLASLSTWLADFESEPGIGSNSWLVSGEYTASGDPLLANDPHLNLMAPPVWYQMVQRCPGMRVRGVSFPGVPFVVIGENDAGAWGFTNAGADVLDTYTYETRDGEYRYGDEWRAFETEERTIEVAGGDDRTVTVRKSVHGPVLEREGRRVGVAWTGLQASRTAIAVHELDRSGGREDALAALSKFDTPTQNAVYADREGDTAYWMTGLVPVRESDGEGAGSGEPGDGEAVRGDRVFDGSAREGVWPGYEPYGEPDFETGWIPFGEKPGVRDPDYVATANQRIADDLDRYIGEGYAAPFRARRIYDLLDERAASDDPFDFASMRRVQRDVVDERARLFVPTILDARESMDDAARAAADRLAEWDYRMNRDSRAALVFELFVDHYLERVFDPVFEAAGLDGSHYPNDWVLFTLGPESRWFADPPAEGVDSRSSSGLIAGAMADAAAEIEAEGYETYGDYNRTAIDHPFGLGFLNYPRLPTDGSPATVRNFRRESAVGSSFRLLARFDGDPSLGMIPGGNDGEYFSEHYSDLLKPWADGEYRPLVATSEGAPDIRFQAGDAAADGGAGDE